MAITPEELRQIADLIARVPELRVICFPVYYVDKEKLPALLKKVGPGTKSFSYGSLRYSPKCAPKLEIFCSNVCTKKQVGTKLVEEVVNRIPAHEEPIFEYDCHESLLAPVYEESEEES